MSEQFKRCSRCGEEKPATPQHFTRSRRSPDGLFYHCKSCKHIHRAPHKPHARQYPHCAGLLSLDTPMPAPYITRRKWLEYKLQRLYVGDILRVENILIERYSDSAFIVTAYPLRFAVRPRMKESPIEALLNFLSGGAKISNQALLRDSYAQRDARRAAVFFMILEGYSRQAIAARLGIQLTHVWSYRVVGNLLIDRNHKWRMNYARAVAQELRGMGFSCVQVAFMLATSVGTIINLILRPRRYSEGIHAIPINCPTHPKAYRQRRSDQIYQAWLMGEDIARLAARMGITKSTVYAAIHNVRIRRGYKPQQKQKPTPKPKPAGTRKPAPNHPWRLDNNLIFRKRRRPPVAAKEKAG